MWNSNEKLEEKINEIETGKRVIEEIKIIKERTKEELEKLKQIRETKTI